MSTDTQSILKYHYQTDLGANNSAGTTLHGNSFLNQLMKTDSSFYPNSSTFNK